jgi:phospholipid/cholesterol/gamma-HCH transport system substrate-binding protein
MSGVTIGRVAAIELDKKRLNAKVTLEIYNDVNEISTDSVASILTAGLLGEKYIGIVPGADDTFVKNGDEIEQTQSSLVLEDLIGKFLFNKATENKSSTPAPDSTPAKAEEF